MNSQTQPQPPAKEEPEITNTRLGPLTGRPLDVPQETARNKKAPSAFRTISEVADELNVQQHVLRFWETKFSQIKPLKRGGGRRYYRPEDVDLLKTIHNLLYTQGYTIKGVQKLFREQGKNRVVERSPLTPQNNNTPGKSEQGLSKRQRSLLQAMLAELKELRGLVEEPSES